MPRGMWDELLIKNYSLSFGSDYLDDFLIKGYKFYIK